MTPNQRFRAIREVAIVFALVGVILALLAWGMA